MILQIDAEEWILLQDVLSASNWKHSEQERKAFKQKLNDAFNEQCHSPSPRLRDEFEKALALKEDGDGQVTD